MVVFASQCALWFFGYLKALGALMGLELAFPKSRIPISARIASLRLGVVSTAASTVVAVAFGLAWSAADIKPLVKVDLLSPYFLGDNRGLHLAWLTGAGVLGAAIGDLAFYGWHRLQHTLLWPIHAIHHSAEDLNVASNFHHVADELIRTFVVAIPFAILLDVRAGPIIAMTGGLQGMFLHSSTRLNFGPLRWLIGDNRFHRIHHSKDPKHWNKNFSAFFPLWDVLFRTAYFPARDEWPETGLADAPEPKTLREFIARPFRGWATYPETR